MKTVKFKVNVLGSIPKGTIIEIPVLIKDENRAILYAPPDKTGCGCLLLAILDSKGVDEIYQDMHPDNWLNLGSYIEPSFHKYLHTIKQTIKIFNDENTILKKYNKKYHTMIKDTIIWLKKQKWYTSDFDLTGYIEDLINRAGI
jgi:hypothetical protein